MSAMSSTAGPRSRWVGNLVGESQDLVGGEELHLLSMASRNAQTIRRVAPDRFATESLAENESQDLACLADRARGQTRAE